MWRLKGCLHCGGDIYIDKDEYGWFESCLQCGHRIELESIYEADKPHSFERSTSIAC